MPVLLTRRSRLRGIQNVVAAATVLVALVALRPSAQTVFRSNVQYVTVDTVVTDKDDRPVENLGIDDFEIVENGKTQKIADFQFVSIPAVSRNIPVNVAPAPEPDVATNIPPSPKSRLFAIVVDDLHLIEQDLVRIKRVLTDLVNAFSPDDEVAIVFTSHSEMSVNFTQNAGRIMAPINNLKNALGFGLDSLGTSETSRTESKYKHFYAMSANATVRSVVRALAGSGHTRRAVFYVTGGSIIQAFDPDLDRRDVEYDDDMNQLFGEAKRSDVPIYTIDPRGNLTPEESVRGGIGRISSGGIRSAAYSNIIRQHNNLSTIAVNTGGRAVFGASDMARMVTEIVKENGSYYVLGYYPDPFVADGKFHDLKVHVKRDGVRVRARSGYDAPKTGRASMPAASSVDKAMAAGVNVAGLSLRAFAEPIASDGKKLNVAVSVEVTYPAPADGSGRFDDNLDLKILALDPDAKTKVTAGRVHHFTGPAPATGSVTFLINEVILVPAQFLTLRIGVGSQALGKAGTVMVPIDMPKESKGLTMGGIAVGFDGPKREAVMQPDAFANLIPFQPTTTRVFSAGDVLRLFGHVYWKEKVAQPSVMMTLTSEGAAPVTVTPQLIAQKPAGDQQDAVIAAMLPMRGLAPAKYHLAISAALPGGKPVTRDVLFEVR